VEKKSIPLILAYLGIRFGFDSYWRMMNPLYSYLFELVFVILVILLLRVPQLGRWSFKGLSLDLSSSVIVGFLLALLMSFSQISIPFDLTTAWGILLLILVGPILEEFIFRFALWECFDHLHSKKELNLYFSSFLFSFAHFFALTWVPAELRSFVLIQGLYTLHLGLWTSKRRQATEGLLAPSLVHIGFNVGFFLGI